MKVNLLPLIAVLLQKLLIAICLNVHAHFTKSDFFHPKGIKVITLESQFLELQRKMLKSL